MSDHEANARLQKHASDCLAMLAAAKVRTPSMATVGGIIVHRVAAAYRSPKVLRLVAEELMQRADDLERQLSLAGQVNRVTAEAARSKTKI